MLSWFSGDKASVSNGLCSVLFHSELAVIALLDWLQIFINPVVPKHDDYYDLWC